MTVACEYCDRVFREYEHMEQHRDAKHYYPCEHCDYFFNSAEELDEHEDDVHYIVLCTDKDCNLRFLTKKAMKQHWNADHYFPCKYCNYYWPSQEELDEHDLEEHLTVTCNFCDRLFRAEAHMKQHEIDKHEDVDYFPCHYCSENFDFADTRSSHYYHYHRITK
ncbi:unnamed protein product [Psylliodes chrysocephalus]|uniref:C2H2-type domain-containing protein n=1 Tax=Psylliodes chrysocephalus TaxID=3402493 RepID=A0A9P0GNH3_9CUCU|nr:unnamed protein product [Psylliodes chrysocephala]